MDVNDRYTVWRPIHFQAELDLIVEQGEADSRSSCDLVYGAACDDRAVCAGSRRESDPPIALFSLLQSVLAEGSIVLSLKNILT